MTAPAAVRERPILFSGPMVRAILDGKKSQTRRIVKSTRVAPLADAKQAGAMDGGGFRFASYEGDAWEPQGDGDTAWTCGTPCPYGAVGDRLWVREAFRDLIDGPDSDWASADFDDEASPATYRHIRFEATPRVGMRFRSPGSVIERVTYLHETTPVDSDETWKRMQRRPSIHMPRWASRLTLELTDVRVERLQDISSDDALAEGIVDDSAEIIGAYRVHDPERLRERYRTLWDALNAKRGHGWSVNPWVWVISFKRVSP